MSMGKSELRTELTARRLNETDAERKSRLIAGHLRDMVDWSKVHKVHIYQSNLGRKEVDTQPIIDYLRHNWPETRVVIPPFKPGLSISTESYDVIIIPCLGFDKDRYRLGLGGGFYDRFLAKQPQAQKVGLAYDSALIKKLPRQPHDMRLDMIITEKNIYKDVS